MALALGILGGSFDPIHNGHIAIAQRAIVHLKLDAFYFIPAGIPPHKRRRVHASANQRLEMLRLALTDFGDARIWDGEIRRVGPSYTIDTLYELKQEHPDSGCFFVIGSDNLKEIPTWHRYREVLSLVTLCVASRPGYSLDIPPELREARIKEFSSPNLAVSSTEIRKRLSEGLSVQELIPERVYRYIQEKGLYRRRDGKA